jgi:predicted nucleic acid-binding protein
VRLFLDANVIFSAALGPGTRARALLDLAYTERVTLLTSSFAVEEARRNLASKAPHVMDDLPHVVAKRRISEFAGEAARNQEEAGGLE